jgi:hypothetical protein
MCETWRVLGGFSDKNGLDYADKWTCLSPCRVCIADSNALLLIKVSSGGGAASSSTNRHRLAHPTNAPGRRVIENKHTTEFEA